MTAFEHPNLLAPILALVVWSLVVWVWMYVTRIPAMAKANIAPQEAALAGSLSVLPAAVRQVADNYNHLMEQPTIFYALAAYTYLAGHQDSTSIAFAWVYVALRVVHSLIQGTVNVVFARFLVFAVSTGVLMIWAGREAVALFAS